MFREAANETEVLSLGPNSCRVYCNVEPLLDDAIVHGRACQSQCKRQRLNLMVQWEDRHGAYCFTFAFRDFGARQSDESVQDYAYSRQSHRSWKRFDRARSVQSCWKHMCSRWAIRILQVQSRILYSRLAGEQP